MITSDELTRYCQRMVYQDHPVMPATRMQLGYAVAMAERECVLVDGMRETYTRVLTTTLGDVDDPLSSLTVIAVPRPRARHRQIGLIRRIIRRFHR